MPLTKIDDRGLNTPIDLLDNEKIRVGTGNDLHIYHDASHNVLESKNGEIRLMNNNDYMFRAVPGGANRLYFANSTKAETLSTGFMVNGHFDLVDSNQIRLGSSQDFKIYHDGTNSITFFDAQVGGVRFRTDIGNSARSNIILGNGVDLYYNNSKKFETTGDGAKLVSGSHFDFHDNSRIRLGDSSDLQIYHNGNESKIEETGTGGLRINTSALMINNQAQNETIANFFADGAVELYHNNQKKLETVNSGVRIPDDMSYQLGNGADFQLFHNQTDNYIRTLNGKIYIDGIGGEQMITAIPDAEVQLYYNGSKKFETSSTGTQTTGVSKFISGNGSQSGDTNLIHATAGGTANRGIMIGTGRPTGAQQNNGMGYIDAINSESGGYGSQLQLRVNGNRVMVIGQQGHNRVGINCDSPSTRLSILDDSPSEGFNIKHSNGQAGIGIGYNSILATGSNTNQEMYIRAKGNEKLRLGANSNDVLGIEKDSRDVRFFVNAQGWSTQHFNMGGNYDMRVHRRRLNNGQNSVSTHNLFRLRRHNWGWGHFEVRLYQTYYSGSYVTRCRIVGHGAGGNYYSVRTMSESWTNGGGASWGADVQIANASSNSPGNSSTYFCDVQATLPNYTYAVCELIMISGYQTDNANDGGSMATDSYTLWTP